MAGKCGGIAAYGLAQDAELRSGSNMGCPPPVNQAAQEATAGLMLDRVDLVEQMTAHDITFIKNT